MNDDVRGALATVARRLHACGLPFTLGGSGLLWALALVDEVADIDLVLPAEQEPTLLAATEQWRTSHSREGTSLWASAWLTNLEIQGVAVDCIGGMAFRHPDGVARLPVRAAGVVTIDDVEVPYADPALWWAVYRVYKPDKAVLLERVVDARARRAVCAELGLAWGQ